MTDAGRARSQTPAEYIREIRSSYPPKEIDTTSIPAVLKEIHRGNEEDARKAMKLGSHLAL